MAAEATDCELVDSINDKLTPKVDKVNDHSVEHVLELLHAVTHALRSRMHHAMQEGGGEVADLAGMEARSLGFIARNPESTQGELVRRSGRDKGQIARVVKRLRDLGLVEQVEDADDRRNVRLRVTPAGEQLHRDVHRLRKRAGAQALAGFSAEELAATAAILERMKTNLE